MIHWNDLLHLFMQNMQSNKDERRMSALVKSDESVRRAQMAAHWIDKEVSASSYLVAHIFCILLLLPLWTPATVSIDNITYADIFCFISLSHTFFFFDLAC